MRTKRQNIGRHTIAAKRRRKERQNETEEETAQRIERNRIFMSQSRATESSQQHEARNEASPVRIRELRQSLSSIDIKGNEQGSGRRPSRRAAREAAKKIYNTVHNYVIASDAADTDVVNSISVPRSVTNTCSTPRQRQRSYQNIKVPPPNIDLVMECHEELLSTVQAETLLQAQLQYNMVMKTLISLKASNVKIISASADDPITVENTNSNGVNNANTQPEFTSISNSVTIQPVSKKEIGIDSSSNVLSPVTFILS